jgi:hypothetical protein
MSKPTFLQVLILKAVTVTRRKILLPGVHAENLLRSRVSSISYNVSSELLRRELSDAVVRETIAKLKAAFLDPYHYGDNRPRANEMPISFSGEPMTPTTRFDYMDFLGFAISGEEGFEGFAKSIALDRTIQYSTVAGFISLLLIDSGIAFLDRDETINAASDLIRAAEAREELLYESKYAIGKSAREDVARAGGKERHATTNTQKHELLSKWDTGIFHNNKTRAGEWALRQYGVKVETARIWIRAHEKNKNATR